MEMLLSRPMSNNYADMKQPKIVKSNTSQNDLLLRLHWLFVLRSLNAVLLSKRTMSSDVFNLVSVSNKPLRLAAHHVLLTLVTGIRARK